MRTLLIILCIVILLFALSHPVLIFPLTVAFAAGFLAALAAGGEIIAAFRKLFFGR